ncbi:hypothetical protein DCMF_28610 [Candidatus Formimonas warabiya]|uniref:Uncharacterized protein n=1 Tax=Formimonas warabiya TaxID=1761012 RepID=A0A3G1L077_FORW1|nr:hypothetical protein DCMF_28610 [Candidatus Formimonas warabiya]
MGPPSQVKTGCRYSWANSFFPTYEAKIVNGTFIPQTKKYGSKLLPSLKLKIREEFVAMYGTKYLWGLSEKS